MTDIEKVTAAVAKMQEGLQDFLDAVADAGEPEVAETAFLLFEAKGMSDEGLFFRRSWLPLHQSSTSTMVGVFDLLAEDVHHDLRCRAGSHG